MVARKDHFVHINRPEECCCFTMSYIFIRVHSENDVIPLVLPTSDLFPQIFVELTSWVYFHLVSKEMA